MSSLFCTHSDLDGTGSVVLCKYFGFEFDKIVFCDYSDRDNEESFIAMLNPFDKIVIADFSPSKTELDWMIAQSKDIEIYDHHDSSKYLKEYAQTPKLKIVHSEEFCGTKLFFDGYIKPKLPRYKAIVNQFVNLVDTYDTYKTEHPLWEEAQNLNRVLYGFQNWSYVQYDRYKPFINNILDKLYEESAWVWNNQELGIIKKDKDKEETVFKRAKNILQIREDEKGIKFGLIHARSKLSIVCHRLLKIYPEIQYILAINTFDGDKSPGWTKISGRSLSLAAVQFDVTTLDKFNGHVHAAARECDVEYSTALWEGKIAYIPYKKVDA